MLGDLYPNQGIVTDATQRPSRSLWIVYGTTLKLTDPKPSPFYCLPVSVGQKFSCCLASKYFWLRVSHEAIVKTSAGLQWSEGLTRAGGPSFKVENSYLFIFFASEIPFWIFIHSLVYDSWSLAELFLAGYGGWPQFLMLWAYLYDGSWLPPESQIRESTQEKATMPWWLSLGSHHSIRQKQISKYSQHLKEGELGFSIWRKEDL